MQNVSTIQQKRFKQISFTCVLCSYPRSSPSLSCRREIQLRKSPFCPSSSFFFVSHNLSAKARKNTKKSPQFSILHEDVPFDTLTLGYFTGYGSKYYTLSDKRSIYDTIFIQQLTTLMTVQKCTIAMMMNITTQSKIASFVLKHLESYMLANYGKNRCL